MKKKFISILLALSLLLSLSSNVFAKSSSPVVTTNDNVLIDYHSDGHHYVITYDELSGNKIIQEYKDGTLVQKNVIQPSNPTLVNVETNINGSSSKSQFETTDIIKTKVASPSSISLDSPGTDFHGYFLGSIFYSWQNNVSLVTGRYTAHISYKTHTPRPAEYVTNGWSGPAVNLVTAIIGVIVVPKSVLIGILLAYGINAAGNAYVNNVSMDLRCTATDYDVMITDADNTDLYCPYWGTCYVANDNLHGIYNQRYYDGYCPQQWKEKWWTDNVVYGLGRGNIYNVSYSN